MRALSALGGSFLAIVIVIAPACGGGDDDGVDIVDGGGGSTADAAAASSGIGVECGPGLECAAEAPRCLSREGASGGFCSVECASTPAPPAGMQPPLPPIENQMMCSSGYDGPATPACAAPLPPEEGTITWMCILACGDTPMFSFGDCPSNLVCDQDDPTLNGYCFPPG